MSQGRCWHDSSLLVIKTHLMLTWEAGVCSRPQLATRSKCSSGLKVKNSDAPNSIPDGPRVTSAQLPAWSPGGCGGRQGGRHPRRMRTGAATLIKDTDSLPTFSIKSPAVNTHWTLLGHTSIPARPGDLNTQVVPA